ncbi:hypothetical protein BJX63DRAFT_389849 [Aspergillus granulosus]|uniref:Uncharacterized protein n=1 Tax=Aspergillus granulosus TaxID=176169 RepID=A0ABR4HLC8_9EURO
MLSRVFGRRWSLSCVVAGRGVSVRSTSPASSIQLKSQGHLDEQEEQETHCGYTPCLPRLMQISKSLWNQPLASRIDSHRLLRQNANLTPRSPRPSHPRFCPQTPAHAARQS